MIDVWKRGNNGNDLNYQRGGFSSLRGGPPSGTVNICPNMAARVNTGGGWVVWSGGVTCCPASSTKWELLMTGLLFHPVARRTQRGSSEWPGQRGKELRDESLAFRLGDERKTKKRSSERWNLCLEGAYSRCSVGHRRLNGLCHMWYGPADTKGLLRLWPCGRL